jgi:hypothetical protein
VTGKITTPGSTYTIVGSTSNAVKQMDNFQRKKHLATIVMELKNKVIVDLTIQIKLYYAFAEMSKLFFDDS